MIHPGSQLKVVHLLLKDVHLLLKVCVRKKKQIQRCNHVLLVLLEDRLEGSLDGRLEVGQLGWRDQTKRGLGQTEC